MSNFDRTFDIVVVPEGGYPTNPADPGNRAGGAIGSGTCRGTTAAVSPAAAPARPNSWPPPSP